MNYKEELKKAEKREGIQLTEVEGFEYEPKILKAIRKKCVEDCCGGCVSEVQNCRCVSCYLYPFRMGKNPFRVPKVISADHLAKLRASRTK